MSAQTIQQLIVLDVETCYKCGIAFGLPRHFRNTRREDCGSFWCPNGHPQAYLKSEADRLREKLNEQTRIATQMAERANSAESAEQAARIAERKTLGKLKRLTNRVTAGVCPCCHRTFSQLARHMKTKHPESI